MGIVITDVIVRWRLIYYKDIFIADIFMLVNIFMYF